MIKFVRLVFRCCLLLFVTANLVGCASGNTSALADMLSALVSKGFGSGSQTTLPAQPNSAYRYLRVEVEGHPPALLVLGYVDAHPQGEIEVWYSSQREVIKTQNGRIVGTAGLETDWRTMQFPSTAPLWTEMPANGAIYQRTRDEMPGHRDGITDSIEIKSWDGVPPIVLPPSLSSDQAHSYRWFRETTLNSTAPPLPPAWFAWGQHQGQATVVYSEQCLSRTFCLKLQRWPLQAGAS